MFLPPIREERFSSSYIDAKNEFGDLRAILFVVLLKAVVGHPITALPGLTYSIHGLTGDIRLISTLNCQGDSGRPQKSGSGIGSAQLPTMRYRLDSVTSQ